MPSIPLLIPEKKNVLKIWYLVLLPKTSFKVSEVYIRRFVCLVKLKCEALTGLSTTEP